MTDGIDENLTLSNSSWAKRLLGTAVSLSQSETWARAKREWKVLYEDDAGAPTETCVCGHEGLRYLNMVRNRVTGARLYPVGSSCVERFEDDRIAEEQADARALRVLRQHAVAGDLDRPHYSRRAIDALHRELVIDADEHALLKRLFNAGPKANIAEHDVTLLRAVVGSRVVPYLLNAEARITAQRPDEKKERAA